MLRCMIHLLQKLTSAANTLPNSRLSAFCFTFIIAIGSTEAREPEFDACASSAAAQQVQAYYKDVRPGAVLPIPSRALGLPEAQITSGLTPTQRILLAPSRKTLAAIWTTVNDWGADTDIRIVVSPGGWHPFDFPAKVPISREKSLAPQFFDAMTADPNAARFHIDVDSLSLIALSDTPGTAGSSTRAVSLYDRDGLLVVSLYASQAGKAHDTKAVTGFKATWRAAKALPKACTSGDSR